MPRVSKRRRQTEDGTMETRKIPKIRYYRTGLYVRLSEKDGGHGRRDSIFVQQQICMDFVKKHSELLFHKTYTDNGVTGTTFDRPGFEELMNDVRSGKIECIVVKDFSRFGREAVDAVEFIDVVFPSLGVRFISVLDDYDSENPACVQDRVNHILKHFMNDYYAREVSWKLVQAHKASRAKGEFWGNRPPYGYERSKESSRRLVIEPGEREIVQKIFYWYVFEDMSSFDIAKSLNAQKIPCPQESYEIRRYGEKRSNKKIYWRGEGICRILQNPLYIGAAVYGKTRQMLSNNIPLKKIPKSQWELHENVYEPIIERAIFDEAQKIAEKRETYFREKWKVNSQKGRAANGPLLGRIVCGNCGKRLGRCSRQHKSGTTYFYRCITAQDVEDIACKHYLDEKYVLEAVRTAFQYQLCLAAEFEKEYGKDFYGNLEKEATEKIRHAQERYEQIGRKLERLFEHYATGILDRSEYVEIKMEYQKMQEEEYTALKSTQSHCREVLDRLRAKMDWARELLECRRAMEITHEFVERFIEKVVVNSSDEITIYFWFEDIFEKEISKKISLDMEGCGLE